MPPVPGRFFSSVAGGTYYTVAKLHPFSPPTVVRSVPSFFKPIKNIEKILSRYARLTARPDELRSDGDGQA